MIIRVYQVTLEERHIDQSDYVDVPTMMSCIAKEKPRGTPGSELRISALHIVIKGISKCCAIVCPSKTLWSISKISTPASLIALGASRRITVAPSLHKLVVYFSAAPPYNSPKFLKDF
jgi:hypothetical protein